MPNIHTQPCTKHLYTLAGRCIFLLKPAQLLAPTEDTDMKTAYEARQARHFADAERERTSTMLSLLLQEKYWARQVELFSELTDAAPERAKLQAVRDQIAALS